MRNKQLKFPRAFFKEPILIRVKRHACSVSLRVMSVCIFGTRSIRPNGAFIFTDDVGCSAFAVLSHKSLSSVKRSLGYVGMSFSKWLPLVSDDRRDLVVS